MAEDPKGIAENVYLISPGAAVIAAILGTAMAVWPPATTSGKVAWVASFTVLGALAIIGTILDRRQADRAQNERDARTDNHLSKLSRLDANHEQSLRDAAYQLASELERFLVKRLAAAPIVDDSLRGTDRHSEWLQRASSVNDWHIENGAIYHERFAERVRLIANDLARVGVGDNNLLREANQQAPFHTSTVAVVPRQLRTAAGHLR